MLSTFSTDSLALVMTFGLGCLTGVLLFSRVLTYVFKNYKNHTICLLTGFMLGSLNKIWPWRTCVEELMVNDEMKCLREQNILPSAYADEPYVFAAVIAMLAGAAIVILLSRSEKK